VFEVPGPSHVSRPLGLPLKREKVVGARDCCYAIRLVERVRLDGQWLALQGRLI
jgi:hypothetical protein